MGHILVGPSTPIEVRLTGAYVVQIEPPFGNAVDPTSCSNPVQLALEPSQSPRSSVREHEGREKATGGVSAPTSDTPSDSSRQDSRVRANPRTHQATKPSVSQSRKGTRGAIRTTTTSKARNHPTSSTRLCLGRKHAPARATWRTHEHARPDRLRCESRADPAPGASRESTHFSQASPPPPSTSGPSVGGGPLSCAPPDCLAGHTHCSTWSVPGVPQTCPKRPRMTLRNHAGSAAPGGRKPAWLRTLVVDRRQASGPSAQLPKLRVTSSSLVARFTQSPANSELFVRVGALRFMMLRPDSEAVVRFRRPLHVLSTSATIVSVSRGSRP